MSDDAYKVFRDSYKLLAKHFADCPLSFNADRPDHRQWLGDVTTELKKIQEAEQPFLESMNARNTYDIKAVWEQKMAPDLKAWNESVEKIISTHGDQLDNANIIEASTNNAFTTRTSRTSSLTMPLKFRRESVMPFRRENRVLAVNTVNITNVSPPTPSVPYRKDSLDKPEGGVDLSLYPILPVTLNQSSTGLSPSIMEAAKSGKSPVDTPGATHRTAEATSSRNTSKSVTGPGATNMHGKFGFCTTCGPKSTSQWRKGPQGAKTLCNPCGLQWWKSKTLRVVDPSVLAESQKGILEAQVKAARQTEEASAIPSPSRDRKSRAAKQVVISYIEKPELTEDEATLAPPLDVDVDAESELTPGPDETEAGNAEKRGRGRPYKVKRGRKANDSVEPNEEETSGNILVNGNKRKSTEELSKSVKKARISETPISEDKTVKKRAGRPPGAANKKKAVGSSATPRTVTAAQHSYGAMTSILAMAAKYNALRRPSIY